MLRLPGCLFSGKRWLPLPIGIWPRKLLMASFERIYTIGLTFCRWSFHNWEIELKVSNCWPIVFCRVMCRNTIEPDTDWPMRISTVWSSIIGRVISANYKNVMERTALLFNQDTLYSELRTAEKKGKLSGTGGACEVLKIKRSSLYNRMKKLNMR